MGSANSLATQLQKTPVLLLANSLIHHFIA